MAKREFLPHRLSREWAVRSALAAAAAVAGYFSVAHSLAQVIVEDSPALAHKLAPWDGRITATFAASLSDLDASEDQRRNADVLAREALRQDGTAVAAASTLGINAQIRGETEEARRMFAYAEKLSRRDLQTQLWMIEEAVARGDIAGAVRHYDIALRTKRQSWDLLFPILAGASSEAQVRHELVRTLASKPLWAESFVNHVAATPASAAAGATLFLELHRAGFAVPPRAHARAIDALLGGGFAEDAWRYYSEIRGGARRASSRDPRFALADAEATAFDWVPVNRGAITASIQRGERGGVFGFSAPANTGGPLLRQAQMLPGGTYRISGRSSGIELPDRSQPFWALICRGENRELGRVPVPNSSRANGAFSGEVRVPENCPVQDLTLVARPSDAVAGLSGQIDHVQLAPAR